LIPGIIDYWKYPFLASLSHVLSARYPGLRIEDVLKSRDSYPYTRALELLKSIIANARVVEGSGSVEDEVLAFYSLLIGAHALGDTGLFQRIALAFSKHASSYFEKESVEILVAIARKLGLDVETPREYPKIPVVAAGRGRVHYIPKPVALKFKLYLRIVSKRLARDPKYMLVNQILNKGYVYLDSSTFARILEEAVFNYIAGLKDKLEYQREEIEEFIEDYKRVLEDAGWFKARRETPGSREQVVGGEEGVYEPRALPPCMRKLIERLDAGENLSHHERFTVAAFLANIGLDPDTILEFFKKTPDFNEKIARYQIEHISGLKGSKKKYLPYSCDNMKSLGICPITGYCEGGKNPLAVYRRNLKRLRKRESAERDVGGEREGGVE